MKFNWCKTTVGGGRIRVIACVAIWLGFCGARGFGAGAVTPFTSYEAEAGALGGGATVVSLTAPPTTEYSSPQLEASGHAFVQLTSVGQYIQWTNNTGQNITALNLRSCIPDAPAGGGITSTIDLYVNGVFRQAFSVNSLQNYCYEGTNYNGQTDKNPADGDPRGFWNDTHAFVTGAAIAPGSTFGFQMDVSNTASFYYIDVVDAEAPPPPLSQPAGSLSILSYGAVSNNPAVDNTAFINNCFSAAQTQGVSAWIPPGTYYISAINGGLNASGITISGAGPWYSTIDRVTPANNTQGVANILTTVSCSVSNLLLDCNANCRAGNNNNGAVDASGNNWVVDNVWIQHATSSFWCAGLDGIARNCRTLSTWADGGNFNNVQSANGIGMNLTYSNNFVRGTGDDAMAINSVNYNGSTYYPIMSNIAYVNNTALCAWGGKNMGIYGGVNDIVTNNLLCDTARYLGLGVTRFGVNGSDLQSARVIGNVVLRCGGNGYSQQQQGMMIGNGGDGQGVGMVAAAYCSGNIISNSMYDAVGFSTCTNIVFQDNVIINPGYDNIAVGPPDLGTGVLGNAIIRSNTVTGLASGRMVLTNAASGFSVIVPVAAASFATASGVTTEPCAEGGLDLTGVEAGDWSAYTNLNLSGANALVARVAGAGQGGGFQVRLDSPTGTLIGTGVVPGTGAAESFVNVYASLTPTNGTHTVYLVYTGGGGDLFNLEFFGVFAAPPALSYQLVPGDTFSLKALANGKYVTAAASTDPLIAQGAAVGLPQEFEVFDAGGGNIALMSSENSLYVSADSDGASPLIANRTSFGSWETFTEFAAGNGNIALRAMDNGEFVTAEDGGTNALIADAASIGEWQSFTPGLVSGVAPAAPGDVTGTPNNGGITLNWLAATGAATYVVAYATTSGGPYTMLASNVTATSFTSPGFVNGSTYFFVVAAQNVAGVSTNSAQVTITPGTLNRGLWVATSSTTGSDAPGNALDGNLTTRWSTDTSQVSGQWFQVDMGAPATFSKMLLNNVNSPSDYPRGYQVNVSNDGINWGSPVATGTGTSSSTTISFPTQSARYLRITQTGSVSGLYWSIDEFNIFGAAPAVPNGLTAATFSSSEISLSWSASVSASGYNVRRAPASGGTYVTVAANLTGPSFTDTGLTAGTTYYYVVSGTNSYGESSNSAPASAATVATTPPQLLATASAGQLTLTWPTNHVGWRLEVQTNSLAVGLGTNWATVANSIATNQIVLPMGVAEGSVFYRLIYP